ncbi:MAG TPA: BrnA antitoxin family protein [Thermoanaerobaculia bacterium]
MKKPSRTDWERVDAMSDEDIDTSDIPPLDETFFANAEIRMPQAKPSITIRLDPDILEWFKGQGRGYQTRINAVLRKYVEAQKK